MKDDAIAELVIGDKKYQIRVQAKS
jgi:hypothetical protein